MGLDGDEAAGTEGDPGAVVEKVEDLDRAGVGQLPGGGVGLPGLVGQGCLEADEGRARALVRLGCDEAVFLEDAPDGRDRGQVGELVGEVVVDGLGSGVVAGRRQLAAELDDQLLNLGLDLVRAGVRSPRARL